MRFASLGGSNAAKYVAAGRAASNSFSKVIAAQLKTRPDHAGLAIKAMNTASDEKIAGMKAEARLTNVAQKVHADQKRVDIDIDLFNKKSDLKAGLRKAGGIAAIGKMVGVGYLASRDNTRNRPYPTGKAGRDGVLADHQATIDEIEKRRKASAAEFSSTIDNAGNSTGGGAKPGKATNSGGSLTSSAQALDAGKGTNGKGGKYTLEQMTDFAIQGGFNPENARTMAAISMGESGGNAGIDTVQSGLDPNKSNEYSIGLSQINVQAHESKLDRRGWTEADLRDPVKNMTIAKEVYDEVGSFKPWSVYQKGLHNQYMN